MIESTRISDSASHQQHRPAHLLTQTTTSVSAGPFVLRSHAVRCQTLSTSYRPSHGRIRFAPPSVQLCSSETAGICFEVHMHLPVLLLLHQSLRAYNSSSTGPKSTPSSLGSVVRQLAPPEPRVLASCQLLFATHPPRLQHQSCPALWCLTCEACRRLGIGTGIRRSKASAGGR